MPIVGSFILPHGALTLDPPSNPIPGCSELHDAMKTCAERIAALQPDLILLSTPHNLLLEHDFAFLKNPRAAGTAEWEGKWKEFGVSVKIDVEVTKSLVSFLTNANENHAAPFPVQMVTSFHNVGTANLQWAEAIPLYFLDQHLTNTGAAKPKLLFLCHPFRRFQPCSSFTSECESLGYSIASFLHSLPQSVVLLISGDLAHTHSHSHPHEPTPVGVHPSAPLFDDLILDWIRSYQTQTEVSPNLNHIDSEKGEQKTESLADSHLEVLLRATDIAPTALSCGLSGLAVLSGALRYLETRQGRRISSDIVSYAHPTYFGMVCASISISP
eukprot:TRINITY_DN4138_c0_g1_i2.p1 TRINITY_DN4138_c0_g1~~TRINITY_DN4138_c0_g1_i2.p1  ORF type:complete len:328 (+),score=28.29 TRINITY_DN4138_c0_g1_i2:74-1057(+)